MSLPRVTHVASNPEGTRWWALEHEGDYNTGDKLYRVEVISASYSKVAEIPNDD